MWISIINKKKKNTLMEDIMWLIMKVHLTNQLEILSIKTAMLIIKWDKEDRENQVTLRKYKILIWFKDSSQCSLISCLNNGTCIQLNNGYKCSCQPNYYGLNCAICNLIIKFFILLY